MTTLGLRKPGRGGVGWPAGRPPRPFILVDGHQSVDVVLVGKLVDQLQWRTNGWLAYLWLGWISIEASGHRA